MCSDHTEAIMCEPSQKGSFPHVILRECWDSHTYPLQQKVVLYGGHSNKWSPIQYMTMPSLLEAVGANTWKLSDLAYSVGS